MGSSVELTEVTETSKDLYYDLLKTAANNRFLTTGSELRCGVFTYLTPEIPKSSSIYGGYYASKDPQDDGSGVIVQNIQDQYTTTDKSTRQEYNLYTYSSQITIKPNAQVSSLSMIPFAIDPYCANLNEKRIEPLFTIINDSSRVKNVKITLLDENYASLEMKICPNSSTTISYDLEVASNVNNAGCGQNTKMLIPQTP